MDFHLKEAKNHKNGITLPTALKLKNFSHNLTEINLTDKNIEASSLKSIILPESLEVLILSKNNLTEVPESVTKLSKLKKLDVSYNKLLYFDETPKFSETIEYLDISNNNLKGPPYWAWAANPQRLQYLNLSVNGNITCALHDYYFQELMQYTSLVTHLDIYNCKFQNYLELMKTFGQLRSLKMGAYDFSLSKANYIEKFPKQGLDKCYDIEVIDLSNTNIYTIDTNINIYQNLKNLNMSLNNITYLPSELCELQMLETCVISFNNLTHLPEGFEKLRNLKRLYLDHNKLDMLPENLKELTKLETLDLYSNYLYEVPDIPHVVEIDVAQNYCDEPEDPQYECKKAVLRGKLYLAVTRLDGIATEEEDADEEDSKEFSEDEWNTEEKERNQELATPLEEEDWDSDDYWVPYAVRPPSPAESSWIKFVKQKMREGHFCPSDIHPMSVAEKVKYEKMGKPKFRVEVIGQFDDYV